MACFSPERGLALNAVAVLYQQRRKKMAKHITITIKVAYDEVTVDDKTLWGLEQEIDRAVENGMLSPSGEEEVEEFSVEVGEIHD